jgi:hypothetical protein
MSFNNKAIYLNNLTSDIQTQINAVANTTVGTFSSLSADGISGTPINLDANSFKTADISMSGNAFVQLPLNMVNGQVINMLATQDGPPYNWNVNFNGTYKFSGNSALVATSGQFSATIYTIIKLRNRYFVSGISGFTE